MSGATAPQGPSGGPPSVLSKGPLSVLLYLPSLRIGNEIYSFYLVFGRFPAELGPETRSNGSGSINGAARAQN